MSPSHAPDSRDAGQLVAAGLGALKLGDQRNARDCFAQALAAQPDEYSALYWMSYFARTRSDALEYLQRALGASRGLRTPQRELVRQRVRELARGIDPAADVQELSERARAWEAVEQRGLALPSSWLVPAGVAVLLALVTGAWVVLARGGEPRATPPPTEDIGGILIITPTATRLPDGSPAPSPTPTATPTSTPTATPTPQPLIHVVQSGDTLSGIALLYGVEVAAIQEANGIEDPSTLQIGQELVIPPTPAP